MKKPPPGWGGGDIEIFDMQSVLADRFRGEADAEFLEDLAVHLAGHDGGVHLAAVEARQAVEGAAAGPGAACCCTG